MVKVSILCLTYNHKKYIRQALDGFISQKADFDFEVLIHDDASDDGTVEIIKEYQHKYPDIIKPILRKKNLYSQGVRNITSRYLLPKAKGSYIAMCEGDDYWTDPKKLQKQVDFLDKHPEYALCFHPVQVEFETGEKADGIFPEPADKRRFTTAELLKHNFIQTNSVMYRRQNYAHMPVNVMPGDWFLHLYHAQFGKIGFINKVMAAYRRHPGGIWWEAQNNIYQIWKKHGLAHITLYLELLKLYSGNPEYKEIISSHISTMLQNLIQTDEAIHTSLVPEVLEKFPDQTELFLRSQFHAYQSKELALQEKHSQIQHQVQRQKNELQSLRQSLTTTEQKLAECLGELSSIKSSKAWRARNKIARLIGREVV